MAPKLHILIDASQSFVRGDGAIEINSGGRRLSAQFRTLRGGRSEGVQVVEIDNGVIGMDVLPTRGMGIWRVRKSALQGGALNRSTGLTLAKGKAMVLGWEAPAGGPVHPAFVPLMEPAGLGWLDGFSELLCRCGLESNGPPEFDDAGRLVRPLHGRIANTPAKRVELEVDEASGRLTLRGTVDESRFHFQSLRLTTSIATSVGSNEFSWTDEVANIGGRDAILQMLYHFNIGQPLLRAGARISAPLQAVAPLTEVAGKEGVETWNVMPPPRPGSAEQVYVCDLATESSGETQVLVNGLADDAAVSLKFNKRALPCFTVWRNTPAEADGYVLGIEPGTNYPNPRSFEQANGRVVKLRPGETWKASVSVTWHMDSASIAKSQAEIDAIQKAHPPQLLKHAPAEWSAS